MSRENTQNTTILISDTNSPTTPPSSPHESSVEKHTLPHPDNDPQTDSKLPVIAKRTEDSLRSDPGQAILTEIEWTAELDVALLYALQNHKLVGSNKYFHMMCVHDAFTRNAGIRCTIACLWSRVSEWYDLDLLADNELSPFPLTGPKDFCLPPHFSRTQPLETAGLVDSEGEGEGESTSHRLRSIHRAK